MIFEPDILGKKREKASFYLDPFKNSNDILFGCINMDVHRNIADNHRHKHCLESNSTTTRLRQMSQNPHGNKPPETELELYSWDIHFSHVS